MINELIRLRTDLHQIPELGRKEFETQKYILNYCKNFNCTIYTPTETSVILFFDAKKEETICFRSDMDALPIDEATDCYFKSRNKGIMHACGHDGHMAMLLGFAKYASQNLAKLTSNVVCLFQPSEEDRAGAMDIINSNILSKLNVNKIFGFHIWPTLEKGKIFTMPLGMLATSAEVDVDIIGKATHAANRSEGLDALLSGTTLINSIYEKMDKLEERHLISFGKINAGEVRNAVAKNCHIEATMRAFSDDVFERMKSILYNEASRIEKLYGVKININVNAAYPAVINNPDLVNEYKNYLDLNILAKPFLQAEDFGCYTRRFKAMFMLIGCGDEHLLHTNTFDFDMSVLDIGFNTYIKIATK